MFANKLWGYCETAFSCCANTWGNARFGNPDKESRIFRSEKDVDGVSTVRTIKMAAYKVGSTGFKVARVVECQQDGGQSRTHYSFLKKTMGVMHIMDEKEVRRAFAEFEHDMDRCCQTPAQNDCCTRYFACGPQGVGA